MSRDLLGVPRRVSSEKEVSQALLLSRALLGAEPIRDSIEEAGDLAARQQLHWLAEISTRHERRLRNVLREEAAALEAWDGRCVEHPELAREGWDEDKHPRLGGPPNAGWFAATGDSGVATSDRDGASPKTNGGTKPRHEDEALAQAPAPGQPPAQGGAPAAAPGRNKFGEWPDRPKGYIPKEVNPNGCIRPWSGGWKAFTRGYRRV